MLRAPKSSLLWILKNQQHCYYRKTIRDFTWQDNSFFFPSYYPVSHLDTHTNINCKERIAFYFIHLFKRRRTKGAKVAVQKEVAADSNPRPPAISAWTPFLVCKQISFFFFSPPSLLSRSPSSENKGKFRWIKSICSFNFFFFFFLTVSFFSLSQTQFSLRTRLLECFFSLQRSRQQFIRQ